MVPGNKTLLQVSEIAAKHRLKMKVPSTAFIGHADYMNTRDRIIYTDPGTNKIVVRRTPLNVFNVRQFIDEHMKDSQLPATSAIDNRRKMNKEKGIIPPKYVLKYMGKHVNDAETLVYYCKNQLIADMIELWGTVDMMV